MQRDKCRKSSYPSDVAQGPSTQSIAAARMAQRLERDQVFNHTGVRVTASGEMARAAAGAHWRWSAVVLPQ